MAHYLVLTNLRKEDRPQAAHLFPEGALAALEEREAEEAAGASSSEDEREGSEGPCSSAEVAEEACSSGAAVADQLLSLGEEREDEAASPSGAAGEARRGAARHGRAVAAKPSQPAAAKKAAAGGAAAAEQQQHAGERWSARSGRAASRQATIEQASRATKRKGTLSVWLHVCCWQWMRQAVCVLGGGWDGGLRDVVRRWCLATAEHLLHAACCVVPALSHPTPGLLTLLSLCPPALQLPTLLPPPLRRRRPSATRRLLGAPAGACAAW